MSVAHKTRCARRQPPALALVEAARRVSALACAGDAGHALRRKEAAQYLLRLPAPTVTEFGAARAAIAKAIRANVLALSLAGDDTARGAIANSVGELCNALASEPEPSPARFWWTRD